MAISHIKNKLGLITGRYPDIGAIPGSSRVPKDQIPIRVLKDGSTFLDVVLGSGNPSTQKYIFYGGRMPYFAVPMVNGERSITVGDTSIHSLPIDKTPLSFSDGGDDGIKIASAIDFGIARVRFRDFMNYQKFGVIIVNPEIREGDTIKTGSTIDIVKGDAINLTFYAGFTGLSIAWTSSIAGIIQFSPQNIFGGGASPTVRISGKTAGTTVITVNGQLGTTAQVTINVTEPPP